MNQVQNGGIKSMRRSWACAFGTAAELFDSTLRCNLMTDWGDDLFASFEEASTTTIAFMPNGRASNRVSAN